MLRKLQRTDHAADDLGVYIAQVAIALPSSLLRGCEGKDWHAGPVLRYQPRCCPCLSHHHCVHREREMDVIQATVRENKTDQARVTATPTSQRVHFATQRVLQTNASMTSQTLCIGIGSCRCSQRIASRVIACASSCVCVGALLCRKKHEVLTDHGGSSVDGSLDSR